VFFFCFCRSIGAASGISWFYAILPEQVRGRYFASDQFVTAVAAVGTLLASSALFALLPIYPALLLQYGIALAGSTISYFALKELPDAERPAAISLASVARDTPRHLFRPTPFRRYLWIATLYGIVTTPIPPFAAYYLKVGPQLGAGQIMMFEVLRYGGVMVSAWLIRRWIDRAGARPFFLLSVALHGLVAVHWWFFLRTGWGGVAGLYAVYFVLGFGAAAWTVANLNYLPKVIDPAERTLAVSINGAVTSCVGGLSPVLWGIFLRPADAPRGINLSVLQLFFVVVAAGVVVLLPWLARLPEDRNRHDDPILLGGAMLRPFRAATYLVNLIDPRSSSRSQSKPSERKS
jgi:Na+/melibiose symporter-like transporter